MQQIRSIDRAGYEAVDIDLNYAETEGLQAAITRICEESAQAVRDGKTLIVLTDKTFVKVIYLQMLRLQQVRYTITS